MSFVRWIGRAYRLSLNKLARSSSGQVPRGYLILGAIVVGGVLVSGAVSSAFGRRAERTYWEAIYQPTDDSIDVRAIDPLPYRVAIPAACQFDVVSPRRQFLVLASSASSVDALTNIDTLSDIDTLTT